MKPDLKLTAAALAAIAPAQLAAHEYSHLIVPALRGSPTRVEWMPGNGYLAQAHWDKPDRLASAMPFMMDVGAVELANALRKKSGNKWARAALAAAQVAAGADFAHNALGVWKKDDGFRDARNVLRGMSGPWQKALGTAAALGMGVRVAGNLEDLWRRDDDR